MNRQIVWAGAIPLETDLLNTNKHTMVALAKLASAIMGSSTYVRGFACTPTSPASMIVNVGAGEIYSLQNIDGTAYSSIPADTTHSILKQGYTLDSQAFTLTAPSTSGYSINYLIQVAYADTDGGSTVLPYYNASNPSTAWSGPNNTGAAQYTVRMGLCTVSIKAGVAATTGTQTTPSPDTGYTGLYVITAAQGATTVTAANIATYGNAPFMPSAGLVDGIQRNTLKFGTDTGVANAYVVNINPGMLSLSAGTEITFVATNANTGSSTLNVSGTGTYPVLNKFGSILIAGEISAGGIVKVVWSATASSWFIIDSTSAVPTAPTAGPTTNNRQIATTEFVTTAVNTRAPLASPALTGTPTAPTQAVSDNSTALANTAYVNSFVNSFRINNFTHTTNSINAHIWFMPSGTTGTFGVFVDQIVLPVGITNLTIPYAFPTGIAAAMISQFSQSAAPTGNLSVNIQGANTVRFVNWSNTSITAQYLCLGN